MVRSLKSALLFAAALSPTAAAAIDIETLPPQRQRDVCAAYVLIDLSVQHRAGLLGDQAYGSQKNMLIWKMWGKNPANAPALERRVNSQIDAIVAEDPGMPEIVTRSDACRVLLGLGGN